MLESKIEGCRLVVKTEDSVHLQDLIEGLDNIQSFKGLNEYERRHIMMAIHLIRMVWDDKLVPRAEPTLGDILGSALNRNMKPNQYNKIAMIKALREFAKNMAVNESGYDGLSLKTAKDMVEHMIFVNDTNKSA